MAAMGVDEVKKISASMICLRSNDGSIKTYNELIKQYGNRFTFTNKNN